MFPEKARMLAGLLREIREHDDGFFPTEAWFEIHKAFAIPYVEIVIPRPSDDGRIQFFLSRREENDPHWPGRPWHIAGGMWRVGHTRENACADVARRELGISVTACREVMTYKWPDHPYANPISHVCICVPATVPKETASAGFFPISDLPEPLLLHHKEFLMACYTHLAGQS